MPGSQHIAPPVVRKDEIHLIPAGDDSSAPRATTAQVRAADNKGQRVYNKRNVTNDGYGSASDVTAQITLPYQLRADYCGYYNWYSYGCDISGSTHRGPQTLGLRPPGGSTTAVRDQ